MTKGIAAGIDWFGRITFTLLAGLIWLGYCALQLGWPPRIAANFARLEPGFDATFAPLSFSIAIAATLVWLVASARSERTVLRAITHWAYGITLMWLLLTMLWLGVRGIQASPRPDETAKRLQGQGLVVGQE